ncbi:MAG: outer membrane beta-barrel protein [Pyrinomonadaceae bacterium]
MPTHKTTRGAARAARLSVRILTLAVFLCAAGAEARAIDPCVLGLPSGTAVPAPDGIRGTHWNDAAVLVSGQPCLPSILDGPANSPVDKTIRVYSKRYTTNGQAVIGFFFEVQDSTQDCPGCPGGVLMFGERIVLQFDPDLDGPGDGALESDDRQIIITHKWGNAPTPQATVQVFGFNTDCPDPVWAPPNNPFAPAPTAVVRSDQVAGGGYTAEVVVPLALLGNPNSNVGFAFAVINDNGECAGDICNGFGAGFPNAGDDVVNTLRLADDENPVTPGCSTFGDWIEPDAWGTAAWGLATGTVTVDRTPNYWSNDGLWVLECGAGDPVYTWYKNNPCKARLEARLRNSTAATQMRNLVFLWSEFGTGDPATYKVVGILEGQSVPVGTDVGPYSIDFTNMPSGNAAHPCVRVYVLPPNYLASFDKAQILAITQRDGANGLTAMATAYGLGIDQWTQKNISAAASGTVCPTCPVAGLRSAPGGAETAEAEAAPSWPRAGASGGRGPSDDASALPVVYATADTGGVFSDSLFGAAQTQTDDKERPPLVERPGRDVRLTRRDMARIAVDSVVVQVRTYGYGRPTGGPPRFNFIEQMGGIIQVVPLEVLRKLREVPFEFRVTNPRQGRTVFHRVDVYLSPNTEAENARVSFDTRPSPYAAEESRVVRGYVTLPGKGVGGEEGGTKGDFKRWGLSLHAGASIPHGTFNNIYNPGPNAGVDLEYRLNRNFSLEAVYTFNRFSGETFDFLGQPFTIPDVNLHVLSLNGKVYGSTSPVRPFFNFGGGVYVFGSGASTRGGLNAGGGLQFDLTPTVALDSMYNFHNVFTSGSSFRYSTAQGGVRFRF